MRFHAVTAVTGCIGMVNISGVWLTGRLVVAYDADTGMCLPSPRQLVVEIAVPWFVFLVGGVAYRLPPTSSS